MNPIKFYKNSTTGNWTLGPFHKLPPGQFTMTVSSDSSTITLWNGLHEVSGLLSDFVKEDGTPYNSLEEFDLAVKDFFH